MLLRFVQVIDGKARVVQKLVHVEFAAKSMNETVGCISAGLQSVRLLLGYVIALFMNVSHRLQCRASVGSPEQRSGRVPCACSSLPHRPSGLPSPSGPTSPSPGFEHHLFV